MESFFALLQKNVLDRSAGRFDRSCGWRSSPGSSARITGVGGKADSAD
jgi:hypothetical protein